MADVHNMHSHLLTVFIDGFSSLNMHVIMSHIFQLYLNIEDFNCPSQAGEQKKWELCYLDKC